MNELETIYRQADKNLRRGSVNLIKFAQSKGFKYYAEYVCETLASGTSARQIVKDMRGCGIDIPPSIPSVWGTKYRVSECIKNKAEKKDTVKKEGYCYQCDYKRKIAPGNHALCRVCDKTAKRIIVCQQHGFAHNCSY